MSELVIRVVVEQAAAKAPAGAYGVVTPLPKYGLGKVLYFRRADGGMRPPWDKFRVRSIRISAEGVTYCDADGLPHLDADVAHDLNAACSRWNMRTLKASQA